MFYNVNFSWLGMSNSGELTNKGISRSSFLNVVLRNYEQCVV